LNLIEAGVSHKGAGIASLKNRFCGRNNERNGTKGSFLGDGREEKKKGRDEEVGVNFTVAENLHFFKHRL